MSVITRGAKAVLAITGRALNTPQGRKAIAALGATAVTAGATYLGVDLNGSTSDDARVEAILKAAGNPQTLSAVLVHMMQAADHSNAYAALAELEKLAKESDEPEVILSVINQVRDGYGRALNTGDGTPGAVEGSATIGDYLKGHVYVRDHLGRMRQACANLGLTKHGLRNLRSVMLMDEDVFEALYREL